MPEKLMTLKELSDYLHIREEKLTALVKEKSLPAYKIGGELLRFRKEQIDAMRAEIESRITGEDRIVVSEARQAVKERFTGPHSGLGLRGGSFKDRIEDWFHFNDFYVLSGVLIVILLFIIFRG